MSDDTNVVGAPEPDASLPAEPVAPEQPRYLTYEESLQQIAQLRDEIGIDLRKYAQSFFDKTNTKVKTRLEDVDRLIKLQEEIGQPYDALTSERLRLKAIETAYRETEASPAEPPPAPAKVPGSQPDAALIASVKAQATAMAVAAGVDGFTEQDPEYDMVQAVSNLSTPPDVFLRVYDYACKTKSARLGKKPPKPATPPIVPSAERGAALGNRLDEITQRMAELQKRPYEGTNWKELQSLGEEHAALLKRR